jgi:predicted nucleotidyltransferase
MCCPPFFAVMMPEDYSLSNPEKAVSSQQISSLADSIATEFSKLPQVVAVALSGSQTSDISDDLSDLDFYVYVSAEIPVEIRCDIAKKFSDRLEINNQFWEPGDEWIDKNYGIGIDIMYRSPAWIEEQLNNVLVKHQASVGYSTCFWWNVLKSKPLYDTENWFRQLRLTATQPYPEALRQAIIAKNYPILRNNISAYTHQIQSATRRNDLVSINHRIAALIASYFDIIFAVNYLPHPGEKRLVQFANKLCDKLPKHMEQDITSLIISLAAIENKQYILEKTNALIDSLDELLINEKLLT